MTEGSSALALPPFARVRQPADIPAALRALKVERRRPVLVSVGGAGGITSAGLADMARILEPVVLAMDRWGATVLDGGTDSGVMKVIGQARQAAGAQFPLVGVAAEGTVILPGMPAARDAAGLEPHHSHIILVPGSTWGDESPWLSRIATSIADGRPSVTLVVNGGEITYDDITHSLQSGRPVIVVAGTGRTADAIAAARDGRGDDLRAMRIAASDGTQIVQHSDPEAVFCAVESILATGR
jgi:SLOG in TRPM, prokaryote